MPATTVYIVCSLCTARTTAHASEDYDVAWRGAVAEAEASGFRHLPGVAETSRKRFEGWLCRPCVGDVVRLAGVSAEPGQAIPEGHHG